MNNEETIKRILKEFPEEVILNAAERISEYKNQQKINISDVLQRKINKIKGIKYIKINHESNREIDFYHVKRNCDIIDDNSIIIYPISGFSVYPSIHGGGIMIQKLEIDNDIIKINMLHRVITDTNTFNKDILPSTETEFDEIKMIYNKLTKYFKNK